MNELRGVNTQVGQKLSQFEQTDGTLYAMIDSHHRSRG